MDGLRWLLLLFGLLVIAGVYFYSRRDKEASGSGAIRPRVAPRLDDNKPVPQEPRVGPPDDGDNDDAEGLDEVPAADADKSHDAPQKIVTVRVVAKQKKSFPGDDLILSMRGIGLRHGKFGIFHRYEGSDDSESIFSAASLVEPGSFDLQNIKDQQIPGISLFLVLPGPVECVQAFDLMMAAGRALAQSLDGELLDESGSTLSIQRERYLREEIIQFQHSKLTS